VRNPNSSAFVERLRSQPNFDFKSELASLVTRFGDSVDLLQAIITEKLATKDDACRFWADSMNVAYVDPFASTITDEAVEKIPAEVAKKAKAIGLYVINGVLTAALAGPADAELVKRLSLIAQIPISPVFALPARSKTPSRSITAPRKSRGQPQRTRPLQPLRQTRACRRQTRPTRRKSRPHPNP